MNKICQFSSLEKIFPFDALPEKELESISVLANESFSYQVTYTYVPDSHDGATGCDLEITLDSPLKDFVTLRTVENIPAEYVCHPWWKENDDNFLKKEGGLFPDLLKPLEKPYVESFQQIEKSIWVSVKLDGSVPAGNYPIHITFTNKKEDYTYTKTMQVEIVGASMPEQEMKVTRWFHCDCIASVYNVEIFSERHWELIEKFMKTAADNGINMILTPIFTPPLDTEVGTERPTVQLVGVEKKDEQYTFDFSLLKRWIDMAHRCGIRYFEMAHLFSQWGVEATPKIVATVDGEEKRIFGWDTPSTCDAYKNFMDQFLPQLTAFLRAEGVAENTVFHISDEPHGEEHRQNYINAKAMIRHHLEGFTIMDALNDVEFYKTGAVECPVPTTDGVEKFLEVAVPERWVYYCCGTNIGLSNQFFAMPSWRNRVIGAQFYKYGVEGFLQWGYNFYYSRLSREVINPFLTTDAKYAFPAGDAFSVYPGPDGPWESLRILVFYDALQDVRAMRLLESYIGKDAVIKLIDEAYGTDVDFHTCPKSADPILNLRERIHTEIKKHL